MNIVQQMLTLLGGTAAAIAALAWLAKSLMGHLLQKDIESYKAVLSARAEAELEKLRAVLERESLEHEIKYRRTDEKVAEHLGGVYVTLFNLYEATAKYVAIVEHSGEPNKDVKFDSVVEANKVFWDYFLPNRLYVPPHLFKRIKAIAHRIDKVIGDFTRGRQREEQGQRLSDEDYWMKAYQTFEKDVTPLFSELVEEFQRRLGIEDIDKSDSAKEASGSIVQEIETQEMPDDIDKFTKKENEAATHRQSL